MMVPGMNGVNLRIAWLRLLIDAFVELYDVRQITHNMSLRVKRRNRNVLRLLLLTETLTRTLPFAMTVILTDIILFAGKDWEAKKIKNIELDTQLNDTQIFPQNGFL